MNCEAVREQLSLYLYGELADPQRAALDAHVKDCSRCAQVLAEEERLQARLRERRVSEPSPDLLVLCRTELGERLEEEALGWRGLLRAWFGGRPLPVASRAVAVVALLVAGFGAGWTLRSQSTAVAPSAPAGPFAGADLSGMRISGIRDVSRDPQTGIVRLSVDAERSLALEGTLDDPRIQRILVYTVKNYENPGIRHQTLEVLRTRPSNPGVRDALVHALLHDENAGVRREALDALSGLGWDEATRQAVVQVLGRDTNAGVRVAAINLLATHADESMRPVLRELAVKDQNPYVRWKCADTLRGLPAEY